jgi:hypothetical protein
VLERELLPDFQLKEIVRAVVLGQAADGFGKAGRAVLGGLFDAFGREAKGWHQQ